MCGIVGYWDKKGADLATAALMSKQIQYRGPDDSGTWLSNDKCLAFAHRIQFSIILVITMKKAFRHCSFQSLNL